MSDEEEISEAIKLSEDNEEYPEAARAWRMRAAAPTREGWSWDIASYEWKGVDESLGVSIISSGNAGEDFEGFDGEFWGGRADDDGELWLGIQSQEGGEMTPPPSSLVLEQIPDGHCTSEIFVEYLNDSDEWIVFGHFEISEGRVKVPIVVREEVEDEEVEEE